MGLRQLARFFNEIPAMLHGASEVLSPAFDVSKFQSLRMMGKITADVGSVGTVTVNLYGYIKGWLHPTVITTLTITANGATPVYKASSLADIRGFEEVKIGISYAAAGIEKANIEVWGAIPFEY